MVIQIVHLELQWLEAEIGIQSHEKLTITTNDMPTLEHHLLIIELLLTYRACIFLNNSLVFLFFFCMSRSDNCGLSYIWIFTTCKMVSLFGLYQTLWKIISTGMWTHKISLKQANADNKQLLVNLKYINGWRRFIWFRCQTIRHPKSPISWFSLCTSKKRLSNDGKWMYPPLKFKKQK